MLSKKVLIMPTRPQSSPENVPPEGEGPVFGPGPISASDIRTLYTVIDIQRTLGGMEHAIKILEITNTSHGEKLQQVVRQTDRTEFALTILEKATVLQGEKLNQLGKDVHVAKTLVSIIVATSGLTALVLYLVHGLAPFFAK